MAACIENCRSQTSVSPCLLECTQYYHMISARNSLFWCTLWPCKPGFGEQILDAVCASEIIPGDINIDDLWLKIQEEAVADTQEDPLLHNYYFSSIFSYKTLETALANLLAMKLSNSSLSRNALFETFLSIFSEDHDVRRALRDDLKAAKERDPACISYVHCLLNFKGFQACQAYRAAHKLWSQGRKALALLIQSRVSDVFAVDIHPGAKIGSGLLLDHGTGIVIGETAIVGDNVTILHNVTLGGTGKASGDHIRRHPKIGDGVFIGAGSKVLGSIRIGEGAKIGAGSMVLKEVPPNATAVGNPARIIGA
ncbi:serine acetyltransferase 1, chloroplastic-like [Ziziphus jujuba]|uniref:serine O-acetyltransferase n=1 Tax=Ziziphus jujuba TaxID=326968 RepID=A0A6P4A054_ZIZJJ|nr:serine acetyltransferase 1, chloroplastic-like [Ziziphus jujuba]